MFQKLAASRLAILMSQPPVFFCKENKPSQVSFLLELPPYHGKNSSISQVTLMGRPLRLPPMETFTPAMVFGQAYYHGCLLCDWDSVVKPGAFNKQAQKRFTGSPLRHAMGWNRDLLFDYKPHKAKPNIMNRALYIL